MEESLNQTNILLCGSSRVGKSTLINAICQEKLAQTSSSLNSQTKHIERYSYQCSNGKRTHVTNIWDTPGIESWNEDDVRDYMKSLIKETQPLCMIYCASPGSFAQLNHVQWLVSECHHQNIFCALVCTNMWAGRNRQELVNEFCRILSIVHPRIISTKEDNITYYDKVALVTMVNSKDYIDVDFDVQKPPSGVEELIFGIGKSLQRDLMFAWFKSVSKNKPFWSTMSSKINNLLQIPFNTVNYLFEHTASVLDFLFDIDNMSDEHNLPSTYHNERFTTDTTVRFCVLRISLKVIIHLSLWKQPLFHDAELIDMNEEMHQNKLTFTFPSESSRKPKIIE